MTKYLTLGRKLSEDNTMKLLALAIRTTKRNTADWDELVVYLQEFQDSERKTYEYRNPRPRD